jgi:hypothetical protein
MELLEHIIDNVAQQMAVMERAMHSILGDLVNAV